MYFGLEFIKFSWKKGDYYDPHTVLSSKFIKNRALDLERQGLQATDESQKRSLKNELLTIVKREHIVNVIDLVSFLEMYGESYGIDNMNYVH